MSEPEDTFTVTYKGKSLTYEFLYELCDFVMEVDELDWDEDEILIEKIAQSLDKNATKVK